jgi:hypothetical protein
MHHFVSLVNLCQAVCMHVNSYRLCVQGCAVCTFTTVQSFSASENLTVDVDISRAGLSAHTLTFPIRRRHFVATGDEEPVGHPKKLSI